jgi:hypothetical protein
MKNKVKGILRTIVDSVSNVRDPGGGLILNERYIHHTFSYLLRDSKKALPLQKMYLHPEWPTFKKSTGIARGKYRNVNGRYQVVDRKSGKGSSAWIDFAVGDYANPEIGIEFSAKEGWSHEEVVFDFLKLLDPRNGFDSVFSINIILRKGGRVQGGYLRRLEQRMDDALSEAFHRLPRSPKKDLDVCFSVTEVDVKDGRGHWHSDGRGPFVPGLF